MEINKMDLENDIKALEEKVDKLLEKTDDNAKLIGENRGDITENKEQIIRNTSAFEILRTFKIDSIMFFVMWLLTFIGFVVYIILNR